MIDKKDFHTFLKKGHPFLFLTEPVAIFKIDKETCRVLRKVEDGGTLSSPLEERIWKDVCAFIEYYCQKALHAKVLRGPEDITERVIGLYLFISQECNLRCTYCYAGEGEYDYRGLMGVGTLKNTFRTFLNGKGEKHFITFFGGEPLLNFPIMKKAAELAQEYRKDGKADISLGIVTNGTLWNQEIHSFFREHIRDVTFSLDGPKGLNDKQRISKSGFSVHDTVSENIRKLTQSSKFNWAFRSIVTSLGCDRVAEIYEHLDSFKPGGIGIVNVDVPKDNPLYLDDEQYRYFIEQILEINRKGLRSFIDGKQPVAFEYPFYILFYFISRSHALYHCNAGTNLLAVTAHGDVYPCHRFVGIEEFKMGNVSDQSLRKSKRYMDIRQKFIDCTVDNREGCRDCWSRYLCGGSCFKYSHAEYGDISLPVERHCFYIKTIIEELLPDIVEIIEKPEERQTLMKRLAKAISDRYGNRSLEDAHVS